MMAAVALDTGAVDDEVSAESLDLLDSILAYGALFYSPPRNGFLGSLTTTAAR